MVQWRHETGKSFQTELAFGAGEIDMFLNVLPNVLPVVISVCGIMIVLYMMLEFSGVPGTEFQRFFRKKWQKKLENLFKRYVKTLDPRGEGETFGNARISSIGYLEADVYRDVLGEKIVVRKNVTIERSTSMEYGNSLLEILDNILEKTGCKTAEELEMWLEKRGC